MNTQQSRVEKGAQDCPSGFGVRQPPGDVESWVSERRAELQTLQTKAAADAHFWSGDWRLGMAEERVTLAEKRLAAAEMTISSRLAR